MGKKFSKKCWDAFREYYPNYLKLCKPKKLKFKKCWPLHLKAEKAYLAKKVNFFTAKICKKRKWNKAKCGKYWKVYLQYQVEYCKYEGSFVKCLGNWLRN